MIHYKVSSGKVRAFEEDGSQDYLITDEMVKMTAAETKAHLNPPTPEKSIQNKIDDLENSITKRNYREFVMGNQYSIDKINQVEADIDILRAKL